ncbi:MAG: sugar transferase [Deltaproteobacteria bacterium]|nr:sugar transferase [Deltaproteobacteria bacterium]MBW1952469.1 sugar transferase [Deltaproteobacteria bacterium]MBW2135181.1 sugar transferase [Deltaproteobacteria bacterium]
MQYQKYTEWKRILDLVGASLGLTICAPVMAIIAVLIRFSMGCPVLFRQPRTGLYGRAFQIIKFRTMSNNYDENGCLLTEAERLTSLGKFLRSTSLDELPELFNVLKGEMSLVGPRPLLMQYLERYTPEQRRRHEVKPGITGWAQVSGRNAISWEDKFALDLWYVDHQSLWLDLKIIAMTIGKILRRQGINQPGCVGSEEFLGTTTQQNSI